VDDLFAGFYLPEEIKAAIVSSLFSGHHLLILGPPGSGKSTLARRICSLLGDIEAVDGCPLNCPPQNPSCPWCLRALSEGKALQGYRLPGQQRIKKVQGSHELVPEDLIGDLDPEVAFKEGLHSLSAFIPGKLLRANRGILVIDFIDRMPERVLNMMLTALEGGSISLGAYEESFPLDMLVIATGSQLEALPLDLIDHFDVVHLDYPQPHGEREVILSSAENPSRVDEVVDIVHHTRVHHEVDRGVSTRGAIKYAEVISSLEGLGGGEALRKGAFISLPHRLKPSLELDIPGKREEIVEEILSEVLGGEREEPISLTKEDILELVEEIAREEKFRKPLKYGAFDVLLRRIHHFPESKLAHVYKEALLRLQELYPERFKRDNITEEILREIEETRRKEEKLARLKLEREALERAIQFLEEERILERGSTGWELSHRGITFLLERLAPRVWQGMYGYGYGKHSTGKKLPLGEGRVVGIRKYRFGDRYRDISFKDTMREVIRKRHQEVVKEDIMVTTKDIRAKLDIILVIDLSGTMRQLDKLWYAKESAIALSLAAAQSGDRVGVVSFSNLAEVVVDITSNPHKVTKRVIDLDLHPNAFTNIGYGLLKATQMFEHHRGGRSMRHIILISDGDATAPHPSPPKYALKQAAEAARKGITISCVCINEESTNPELMRRIAKIGKGRIHLVGPEEMTEAVLLEKIALGS
jgi:MoxR-like ATPase/Mg-chelatase subunit ChlD